jgi:purine nucleosidase
MSHYWIDTDIALGSSSGDVDDGWAIATLLRAVAQDQSKKIYGISVCGGNTNTGIAYGCAAALLDAMQLRSIPLLHSEDAARAMVAVPDDCTILALGPLTNVAAALTIEPGFGARTRLCVVGGVIDPRRWRRRLSDLNMRRNRAAAALVLGTFQHIRHYPLDVIDRLRLAPPRMARIAALGELGTYLAKHSVRWMRRARFSHGRSAFPVWDMVATLDATGHLAGARFDEKHRLIDFDVDATWANVEELLRDVR